MCFGSRGGGGVINVKFTASRVFVGTAEGDE